MLRRGPWSLGRGLDVTRQTEVGGRRSEREGDAPSVRGSRGSRVPRTGRREGQQRGLFAGRVHLDRNEDQQPPTPTATQLVRTLGRGLR